MSFVAFSQDLGLADSVSEPESLANLVTNMAVAKCANAHDAYLECTNYAVTQLNLDNVAMYLDAGEYLLISCHRSRQAHQ